MRCRVRIEPGSFSWHRASARCPTAVFGTKTPPGRAVPRKIPNRIADRSAALRKNRSAAPTLQDFSVPPAPSPAVLSALRGFPPERAPAARNISKLIAEWSAVFRENRPPARTLRGAIALNGRDGDQRRRRRDFYLHCHIYRGNRVERARRLSHS